MVKDSTVKATDRHARSIPRTVTRSLKVHEMSEGIGLRIKRFIGNRQVRCLPPFVICEQFKIDETGRPPHPARGAQKITFVLTGKLRVDYSSEDSVELGPGDVTSLMVGKGVIKSIKAIPDDSDTNNSRHGSKSNKATASGMQIYMDVPEPFKRIDHSHLNLCHTDIVSCEPSEGCKVRILTGSAFGTKADQMLTATPALMLDCELRPGATVDIPVKVDWNAFAYVIDGKSWIQGEKTQKSQYVEFMRSSKSTSAYSYEESSDSSSHGADAEEEEEEEAHVTVSVDASATHNARVLFCAAKPLCQPIYRQGPFVDVSMNWIYQAFDDYTAHKNGFESTAWKGQSLVPSSVKSSSDDTTGEAYSKGSDMLASSSNSKPQDAEKSKENEHTYKPCETNECDDDENPQDKKVSKPNAFPPGIANPASYSVVFNGDEGVEEQQEQMLPRQPSPPPKRKADPTEDRDASEPANSPPPKKR